jgi:dolichol-phosphate mannosyltransferase
MSELHLSVVIPAHNEEDSISGTIHALAGALDAECIPYEIVVVDDHSTDRTREVLRHLSDQYPFVRWVSNERSNGFGQAVHTGLDAFAGDAFCLVMADGSDDPRDVIRYYRKLLEGHECVFGSRFTAESKVVNYPKHKLLLNRLANLFIRLLFGLKYNDVTNAFKCYRRNVIEGVRPLLSHHFNLTVELPLKAIVRGFSYTVVPIHWYGRVHGVSKLRIQEMGSRYLFIVLYVLLERLLSRGDYVRTGEPAQDGSGTTMAPPSPVGWAWLGLVIVFVVQMLFVYTYPLNHLGGDSLGYEYVLMNRTSNLLFAPGYMALASMPLRVDVLYDAAMKHPDGFRELLQFGQHAFEIVCLAVLLLVLARVYNKLTAFLGVLIAGTSARAMGVNSSIYPEWLQADLLVLAFCLAVLAYTTPATRRRKVLLYAAAFGAFTWCLLTKFNSIAFLPGLLAFFLFEKMPWRRRATIFLAAASFGFVNYAAFVLFLHKPATGTFALTCDRSWVLLSKLQGVYGPTLPYPEGIDSKRWLALSSMLPPRYDVASVGIFMNIDSVPPEIRKPMRAKVEYLLDADERVLDDTLRHHRLPESFSLGASSIPISYFVGLRESDRLGVRVFRESILHAPAKYFESVWRDSVAATRYATTESTFPTLANVGGVTERLVPAGGNWVRLVSEPSSPLPYKAHQALIWKPGLRFFSVWAKLAMTRGRTVFWMTVGVLLAIWHGLRYGWSLRSAIPVALGLLLIGFDLFSNAVLEFRWKEWRLAYPIATTLLAVTFGWTLRELVTAISRMVSGRAVPKAGAV